MANQTELIAELAARFAPFNSEGLATSKLKAIVYLYEQIILEKIITGDLVITSLGTFYAGISVEKIGTNPRTKESIVIPQKNRLRFKPKENITRELN